MLLCRILSVVVYVKIASSQNLDLKAPYYNLEYVPFGHIFRDGIDDPSSDFMKPIDMLELHMRPPMTREEEMYFLRTQPWKIRKIAPVEETRNSRDFYIEDVLKKKDQDGNDTKTMDDDKPRWIDFDKIHKENIEGILPKPQMKTKFRNLLPTRVDSSGKEVFGKSHYFSRNVFDIPSFKTDRESWTTCEEFDKDIKPSNVVHPKDIVDIDWEPFYIWSTRQHLHAVVYRFSYPTKKVVEEYKETYGFFLPKSLDWEQPKLVLKERIDMLLIAGDRKGLFHGIPRHHIPSSMRNKNITLPTLDIRLKIVDPYLALMYCNEFYATIMGTADTVPKTDNEKSEEAKILKFKGRGYEVSRNKHLENLKRKGKEEQKLAEEARKIIKALPGYPGIDDIED